MVEAINSVGHVMGKQTIAEFVDSERVMAALREIGVDYAQGYGVAKPQPFAPRLGMARVA
jgi:EAL domain-containing protein (putative c-di-GMP-specific phosphodiesterase class I)